MKTNPNASSVLSQYFALSYLLLLINASGFLEQVHYVSFATYIFTGVVYFAYCFCYIFILVLLFGLLQKVLAYHRLPSFFRSPWLIGSLSVIAVSALQMLIYADGIVFKIFGFHFNSFVWNLIFTEGGITSMGSSSATVRSFIAMALFFLVVQGAIFLSLMLIPRIRSFCGNFLTVRRLAAIVVILIVMVVLQGLTYGLSFFHGYKPILTVSKAFPFYVPVRFNSIAEKLGFQPPREATFKMKFSDIVLRYPLNPIRQKADHKTYNIVFLMAESLRADMLDPQIMPKTWAFSEKSARFKQHYSGGNGTRMALFAAFYGLYGNYWFKFLDERRGPLLVDLLMKNNYQIDVFSSARFSYPEFDKTVFSQLPQDKLHDSKDLPKDLAGWQCDRQNVGLMLDFIEKRDKSQPFMTFMFFESPHALYYFLPENEIRVPYLNEFNYATVDLKKDIQLIKNRYINSCNHLDSQFDLVLKYLGEHSLLDSTIVIITGDHGEEFMEKGRWGHNSAYSEEQTLVPMVLWVPGVSPRKVEKITSHLDIPATVLNILGVENPPSDYSLGMDMLGNDERRFTVVSDWDAIVYVDNEYKAIFPLDVFGNKTVTTKADIEITNSAAFYKTHQSYLVEVMKELSRFSN